MSKKFVKYKRCHVNIGVNNLFYIVISSSSTKTKHHQQNDQKQKWQCSSCSFRDCDCVRECESWRWQKATWLINSLINWLTKLSEKTLEMIWTVWAPYLSYNIYLTFLFFSLSLSLSPFPTSNLLCCSCSCFAKFLFSSILRLSISCSFLREHFFLSIRCMVLNINKLRTHFI